VENDFNLAKAWRPLTDFRRCVNEVELFDPVVEPIRSPELGVRTRLAILSDIQRRAIFAKQLDGPTGLVDVTAVALAATWDERPKEAAAGAGVQRLG